MDIKTSPFYFLAIPTGPDRDSFEEKISYFIGKKLEWFRKIYINSIFGMLSREICNRYLDQGPENFPSDFILVKIGVAMSDLDSIYEERTAHIGIQQKLEDGDITLLEPLG